jgi:hypothetical protein
MGAIISKFEDQCAEKISAGREDIGISIKYNFSGNLLDMARFNKKTTPTSSYTLLDVLYADDCVLFGNSVSSMQIMVDTFEGLATKFGMEVSIDKTKVIFNGVSKVVAYMEAKENRVDEEALQSRNRLRRRTQSIDTPQPPISPRISIRGIPLEIVTSFKYLGLHDTEDGAVENAVRGRVIRMEYRCPPSNECLQDNCDDE